MVKKYYHFHSDGKLSAELFLTKADFVAALNRLAVYAASFPGVAIVTFTFEDTHVHFLLYCTEEEGKNFCDMFKRLTMIYISRTRGGKPSDLYIHFESEELGDESYRKNVAAYVVIQPTKDGKGIMPYDYPWSSAPLYFRGDKVIPVWCIDKNGEVQDPKCLRDMSYREKRRLLKTAVNMPDDWLFCNGIILPSNYVDICRYEALFGTHNAYRAFQSWSADKDIIRKRALSKGVSLPDREMRAACKGTCRELFGADGVRSLNSIQRLEVARHLRRKYLISQKQLSRIVHVPLEELERYF